MSEVSDKVRQGRNRLGIVHFPFTFARYGFEPIPAGGQVPGQQANPPPRHSSTDHATA
jgi:hypothetical protein